MSRAGVYAATVLAYAALYAPQPLLPHFAETHQLPAARAGLLISATLLPLAVAPLSYGLALRRVAPAPALRAAVALLGALQLAFALAPSFGALLAVRVGVGVVLPAVFTAAMTQTALSAPAAELGRAMAGYVAASIVGGFAGRLLTGATAGWVDWRLPFLLLGAALLATAAALRRLPRFAPPPAPAGRPRLHAALLAAPGLPAVLCTAFCLFFVFAGLLNFLPFRLAELRGGEPGALGGLVYTGYLFGALTALGAARAARWAGGEGRAMVAGLALFTLCLALTALPGTATLFGVLFPFCGAMFLVHALATGAANRRGRAEPALVNGLYLAAYYAGGALGTYLPGLVYQRQGWGALVATLLAVAAAGVVAAVRAALAPEPPAPAPRAPAVAAGARSRYT